MGLKIGFLAYDLTESGSGNYARAFIKSLSEKKEVEKIKVLTIDNKLPEFLYTHPKIEMYKIKCLPTALNRYEFILKSIQYIKYFKDLDILHAQHSFEGIFASICKKRYHIPYILVREVVSKSLPSLYSRFFLFNIEKLLTKYLDYDMLVSWSKYMAENYFMKWNIPSEKIKIIPGGVDGKMFNPFRKFKNIRPLYGINEDEFLFLSIKIFSKSNTLGLINSIKAFSKSLERCPKSKYLIIGEGEGRIALENLIKRLGVKDKVLLPGWVRAEELINYYRSSDATIHYFSYEPSISMCMLESLACGVPIITTNIGEIPNVVNENVGFLVNPDISEMSDAMVKIQDSSIRKKMSKNAWKLFKKKFDIDVITKQYVELYKEIVE